MFVIVFLFSVFFVSLDCAFIYSSQPFFVYLRLQYSLLYVLMLYNCNIVHCVYVLIFIDYEFIEMSLLYIEYYYS